MKAYELRSEPAGAALMPYEAGKRMLRVHTMPSVLFIKASCAQRGLAVSHVEGKDGMDIAIVCTQDQLEEVRSEFNGRRKPKI